MVGGVSVRWIGRHKRLSSYRPRDFDRLNTTLGSTDGLVLCPNVLSETSNLAPAAFDSAALILQGLRRVVEVSDEAVVASRTAVSSDEYLRHGLTDAVLLELASVPGRVLLSDDGQLCAAAWRAGVPAEMFSSAG